MRTSRASGCASARSSCGAARPHPRAPTASGAVGAAMLRGQAVMLETGLTGAHEMGIGPEMVAAYRAVARGGRLEVRGTAYAAATEAAVKALATPPPPDAPMSWFALRGIK